MQRFIQRYAFDAAFCVANERSKEWTNGIEQLRKRLPRVDAHTRKCILKSTDAMCASLRDNKTFTSSRRTGLRLAITVKGNVGREASF